MGTDIHGRLQFRDSPNEPYRDAGPIEDERCYRMFAALANVRNGYGFAGVYTHEPLVPISEPRGIPSDMKVDSDHYIRLTQWFGDEQKEVEEWLGDHSHSWLTLSEILAWDGWGKTLVNKGVVTAEAYAAIKRDGGEPKAWCGAVMGPDVKVVTTEQADAGVPHTHVSYEWQSPYVDFVAHYKAWFDYLEKKYHWLIAKDPAAVRIVFGFDS